MDNYDGFKKEVYDLTKIDLSSYVTTIQGKENELCYQNINA